MEYEDIKKKLLRLVATPVIPEEDVDASIDASEEEDCDSDENDDGDGAMHAAG